MNVIQTGNINSSTLDRIRAFEQEDQLALLSVGRLIDLISNDPVKLDENNLQMYSPVVDVIGGTATSELNSSSASMVVQFDAVKSEVNINDRYNSVIRKAHYYKFKHDCDECGEQILTTIDVKPSCQLSVTRVEFPQRQNALMAKYLRKSGETVDREVKFEIKEGLNNFTNKNMGEFLI